jgi:hypothetical protein
MTSAARACTTLGPGPLAAPLRCRTRPRRPPDHLGKRRLAGTLASHDARACMRCVCEEDDGRAVGSESDGGVPLWLSQPGQAAGIRPAWPRSVAPA